MIRNNLENVTCMKFELSHIPAQILWTEGVAGCLIGSLGKKPPTLEWRQEKQEKQEKQEETSNLKSGVQPSDM